jgi:hypothetical protein
MKNKKEKLSVKVKEETKAAEKQRKRMVIQEVDSEEEGKFTNDLHLLQYIYSQFTLCNN